MGIFYTGKGDRGRSVVGKKRVAKTSPIVEALGNLDELNTLIGLGRNCVRDKLVKTKLLETQEALFIIQANLAWLMYPKFRPPVLKQEKIEAMEEFLAELERRVKPERRFIIPGSNLESAWLDYLRSVSRRVERSVVSLQKTGQFKKLKSRETLLAYLNRLSSLFFALARYVAKRRRIKELSPTYQ